MDEIFAPSEEEVTCDDVNDILLKFLDNIHNSQDLNEKLDAIGKIACLSSLDFKPDSLFLENKFLFDIISFFSICEIDNQSLIVIIHNILVDDLFNVTTFHNFESVNLFDIIKDIILNTGTSNIQLLIATLHQVNSFCPKNLGFFKQLVPFLCQCINSVNNDMRFFIISSLKLLMADSECLEIAVNNNIFQNIVHFLVFADVDTFCESIAIINRIPLSYYNGEIEYPDFLSMFYTYLEQTNHRQISILLNFLEILIVTDSIAFFSSNILNELLDISSYCKVKKRIKISFFLARSFSLICKHTSSVNLKNNIMLRIMEDFSNLAEPECLFCLDVIKNFIESDIENALMIAEQVGFQDILQELINCSPNDVSMFAEFILSSFFILEKVDCRI